MIFALIIYCYPTLFSAGVPNVVQIGFKTMQECTQYLDKNAVFVAEAKSTFCDGQYSQTFCMGGSIQ